jgi:heptosyltransferase-2
LPRTNDFSRILVRATNWLGDAVMSLAALRALRERYPAAHIAVQARPWVAELYARESFLDQVIPYEASRGAVDWLAKWRAAHELRRRCFDAAILLPNSFDSALVVWLAGIPRRIGYNRDGRRLLLTDPIQTPVRGEIPRHERFYYMELLRRVGILGALPASDALQLDAAAQARTAGEARFAQLGLAAPVIGVSPGAAYGSAKRWLPERFGEAAVRIANASGGSIAVFGSKDERAVAETVAETVRASGLPVRNLAGETPLGEFIDLVAACRVFLTNDSGAMHVAAALGVPTIAVFGSTDHEGTGPVGPLVRVVREPVECSPCLLRECPIDHRCMTRVSAERVAREALELFK